MSNKVPPGAGFKYTEKKKTFLSIIFIGYGCGGRGIKKWPEKSLGLNSIADIFIWKN